MHSCMQSLAAKKGGASMSQRLASVSFRVMLSHRLLRFKFIQNTDDSLMWRLTSTSRMAHLDGTISDMDKILMERQRCREKLQRSITKVELSMIKTGITGRLMDIAVYPVGRLGTIGMLSHPEECLISRFASKVGALDSFVASAF